MSDTLRNGQQAFNELYASEPEIAAAIQGTEYDPFYLDERLPAFHARVAFLRDQRSI